MLSYMFATLMEQKKKKTNILCNRLYIAQIR